MKCTQILVEWISIATFSIRNIHFDFEQQEKWSSINRNSIWFRSYHIFSILFKIFLELSFSSLKLWIAIHGFRLNEFWKEKFFYFYFSSQNECVLPLTNILIYIVFVYLGDIEFVCVCVSVHVHEHYSLCHRSVHGNAIMICTVKHVNCR